MASQRTVSWTTFLENGKRLEDDIKVSRAASVSAENETVPETIETVTPPSKFKFNFIAAGLQQANSRNYFKNSLFTTNASQLFCINTFL